MNEGLDEERLDEERFRLGRFLFAWRALVHLEEKLIIIKIIGKEPFINCFDYKVPYWISQSTLMIVINKIINFNKECY